MTKWVAQDGLRAVEIYDFIVSYKMEHDGNSPSYREIANGCGLASTNSVHAYVHALIDSGDLEQKNGKLCTTDGQWFLPNDEYELNVYEEGHI